MRGRGPGGWDALTLTELAVAKCVCDGLDSEATADRLAIPRTDIDELIGQVFRKLGVMSRVELVIQAVRRDGERNLA